MLRNLRRALCRTIPVLVLTGAGIVPAAAQDEPPEAERLPLAPQSLLLDVVQQPGGGIVAVGERGHVVFSADGSEWEQAQLVPSRSTLTAVSAAGNLLWAGGHDTTIVFSEDGGRTWELQYFDPERRQPILDMYFVDEQNGFAIGAYGLMLRTYDGGTSWEDQDISEEGWHLNSIADLGGGNMVIAGEAGISYYSNDGGDSWTAVDMPYPGSMFGAIAVGPCVLAFGLRGHIQESCDDGVDWEEMDTPVQYSLAGAAYRDGVTLLAGNSGQILILREDGTFEAELHPSGVDFAAVLPLEDGGWLLVGEEGSHIFGGKRSQ